MNPKAISYSATELCFLKENKTLTRTELHQQFNKKFNRHLSKVNIQAVCKRHRWLTGRNGRFEKGITPWCKGKKFPNKSLNAGNYKSGHIPANIRPAGHIRIAKDGYQMIKTEPGEKKYKPLHKLNWVKKYGPIKKGHVLRAKDGNKLNSDPENWEEISRHENLLLNKERYAQEHESLKPLVKQLCKLQAKIGQKNDS